MGKPRWKQDRRFGVTIHDLFNGEEWLGNVVRTMVAGATGFRALVVGSAVEHQSRTLRGAKRILIRLVTARKAPKVVVRACPHACRKCFGDRPDCQTPDDKPRVKCDYCGVKLRSRSRKGGRR